jgi:hypothetical protein
MKLSPELVSFEGLSSWLVDCPLLCLYMVFPLCVCPCPNSFSYLNIGPIGLRLTPMVLILL